MQIIQQQLQRSQSSDQGVMNSEFHAVVVAVWKSTETEFE